ncbi:hypothetical protein TNIN_412261 [Trichonephila inaurata madagascariensis]|uniref:Uncharacterized protein n=1 Tax=Trichonephila inaurata madagascariensis TaxID=2747483 RepID=A0A8X6YBQ0_9ARAC|nr:hypothetical protein TNIN_412261 [Trichonephila inaurata madagascariensis]
MVVMSFESTSSHMKHPRSIDNMEGGKLESEPRVFKYQINHCEKKINGIKSHILLVSAGSVSVRMYVLNLLNLSHVLTRNPAFIHDSWCISIVNALYQA